MATTLTKPTPADEVEDAHKAASLALAAAFPEVPVTAIGRAMTFLGLVQDGAVALRRTGKAVTPTRYADIVDAAVAKAFDMARCRQ